MTVHRWEGVVDRKRVTDEGETTFGATVRSIDGYAQAGIVWFNEFGPPLANPRPGMRFRWWAGKGVDRAQPI